MRKALIAANWKMHGSLAKIEAFTAKLQLKEGVEVVLFPPAVYLQAAVACATPGLQCGVQDIGTAAEGAHTGEVAGSMVVELGGSWCIVGHSERRMDQGETDDLVATKAAAALQFGLKPVICLGETLAEREAGHAEVVVERQLAAVLDRVDYAGLAGAAIGYEPVWAIGTGQTATPEQAQEMHGFIRSQLDAADPGMAQQVRIVYGGSVKPGNAAELFAQEDIDGGLVGGASLDAEEFSAIIAAAGIETS
jgi:triosephosphate isomerase (TIM)